jgi:hypothetical protein
MAFPQGAKDFLGRLYGEPAKTAPAQKTTAAPRAPRPPDQAAVTESLKSRLATVVQGRSVIAAGSFHLVGLAEIRERLGVGWERVREKVHLQARQIIERHIAPRDVYFPGGADDYVLVFAALGKTAAELVCAKISQELQQTLLGDNETREIVVRTVVSETDGSLRIEKAKLPDLIASAVVAATSSAAAEHAWREIPGPPVSDDRGSAPPAFADDAILYRPVWDVQREVLSTYFSRRSVRLSAAPALRRGTPEEVARLDIEALRAGIEMLADLHQNKFRLRMAFPVGFEAVASPPRLRSYLELCRTIPEHLRKLVAFELVDLPVGVLYGRLAELTTALRPYCGLVLATVDWWRADLSQFANTGIRLVNAVVAAGAEEKRTLADMDRFASAAGKAGLQSAVEGVGTSSLALAAKGAGVDFISGDRIARCLEVPNHMLRISWSEVYFGKSRPG